MPVTIYRTMPNIMYSVFRWLQQYQYTVAGVTAPLATHLPGLVLVPEYPDDLTQLGAPTLALGGPVEASETRAFISDASREDSYTIRAYGFVVGQGSEAKNRSYRDRLMNDVYELMQIAEDEGIPLYDAATALVVGEMEMAGGRVRTLPANALEIEADRFKFTAEAEVPHD